MKSNTTTNQTAKEFLAIKTEEAQLVYRTYEKSRLKGQTSEEIKAELERVLKETYEISPPTASSIAARIYQNFSEGHFQQTLIDKITAIVSDSINEELEHAQPHIAVSLEDYKKFIELTQSDPDITLPLKRLLFSFIVFYRYNYHQSGWIRYDKKNIFYLASANRYSTSQQEKMTKYLHAHYGLNMRVVGSNQPTPCYSMYWLQEQPPVGSPNNPIITLGLLTPEDLATVVDKAK